MDTYARMGGEAFFTDLVGRFYAAVAQDPVLSPMYPEDDLSGAERRLRLFLQQYWGGPPEYSAERGHPRLRMRHMPFRIDDEARQHWLQHMMAALDATATDHAVDEDLVAALRDYLEAAAQAMVNTWPDREGFPVLGQPGD